MHTTKINKRERETDTHKEQKKDGDRGKVETDAQTGGQREGSRRERGRETEIERDSDSCRR